MHSRHMLQSFYHIKNKTNFLLSLSRAQNHIFNASQSIRNNHVGISKYKLYKLKKGPPTEAELTKEDALHYLKHMCIIREMEATAARIYMQKKIRGFLHLASGQEACYVGLKSALREEDDVISAYRVHGLAYSMGLSVHQILSELCGKQTGVSRGRGGSMHIYGKHFYGGNGIVGAQIPIGAGVAFANKLKGNGAVCFTLYGDGASNQGQCFEAFNIAAIWKLPCIFVCENNGYAMGTSVPRHSAMHAFYKKGHYIPGLWINGMDVLAVREGCKFAIDYALNKGPILCEFATYRYYGHSMSDPGKSYRTREEVQDVRKKRDCISLMKKRILDCKLATEDEIEKIEENADEHVEEALNKAFKDPEPDISKDITADVYVDWKKEYGGVRNVLPWKTLEHHNIGKPLNVD